MNSIFKINPAIMENMECFDPLCAYLIHQFKSGFVTWLLHFVYFQLLEHVT